MWQRDSPFATLSMPCAGWCATRRAVPFVFVRFPTFLTGTAKQFPLIRLLETQKGTHNGLDGVLTVPCLTEDDQSVGLKALVGNLKALGDDLAVQVILATVDFCCSLLFLID